MLKLLCLLLVGCMHTHEWAIHYEEKVDVYDTDNKPSLPSYSIRIYVLVCKKCGKTKFRKFKY